MKIGEHELGAMFYVITSIVLIVLTAFDTFFGIDVALGLK